MKHIAANIVLGSFAVGLFLFFDNAAIGSYQGLALMAFVAFVVIVIVLRAMRKAMMNPSQQYHYYTYADKPHGVSQSLADPRSDALDNYEWNRIEKINKNNNAANAAAVKALQEKLKIQNKQDGKYLDVFKRNGWDV